MIEKMEVEGLLKGTASLSGCSIKVGISKTKLTLTGMVHTLDQKGEAERIAWKAIGVWTVQNEILVD
jgi:osmotically-inducible protein OsmY